MRRWAVVKDSDCHRYMIPAEKLEEFYRLEDEIGRFWGDPVEGERQGWAAEFPEWAVRVGGGTLTFTDPRWADGRPAP